MQPGWGFRRLSVLFGVLNLALAGLFVFYPQLKAIDAYGVRHANAPGAGDIARPASFLIDRDGVVRWRDLTANYRVRPRPETILAELDKIR